MKKLAICEDAEELAINAAEMFVAAMRAAIRERGKFAVALAGGSTPKRMYELLADKYSDLPEWGKTFVFFGDERSVAADHEDSNYHMACGALLDRVAVPAEQVFRMEAESDDRSESAYNYQQSLTNVTHALDLVLLGLGDDGHTASIFPDYPDTEVVVGSLVAAVFVSSKATWRMTLTPRAINAARSVVFLISGEGKRKALRQTLETGSTAAARIAPESGDLTYLVDRAAAGELAESKLNREFLDEK